MWLLCLWKALIQRRKVSENKDESRVLDVPTTRVAYAKVTPTISNWIQPIAIETTSRCGSDESRYDRDPVASVDSVAVGSRSSCQCGQAFRQKLRSAYNCI